MAFPTTSVLDDFNRANTGPPPSASWTGPYYGDTGGLIVVSNRVQCNTSGQFGSAYWNPNTYSRSTTGIEVFAEIGVLSSGWDYWIEIFRAGGAGPSVNTPDGYGLDYHHSSTLASSQYRAYRLTGGAQTTLGTGATSFQLAAGDALGMEVTPGGLVNVYKRQSAVWSLLESISDNTHTGTFSLGIELGSNVAAFDNFGGGQTVAPAAKSLVYKQRARTAHLLRR